MTASSKSERSRSYLVVRRSTVGYSSRIQSLNTSACHEDLECRSDCGASSRASIMRRTTSSSCARTLAVCPPCGAYV